MINKEGDPAALWLLERRRDAAKMALVEMIKVEDGEKPWSVYDEDLAGFGDAFFVVTEGYKRLRDEMIERRRKRGKLCVFHAFGGVGVLRSISDTVGLDFGLSLGLSDNRTDEGADYDDKRGIVMMTGDAMRSTTWKFVRQITEEKSPQGYDFIVSVPMGGWGILDYDPLMHFMWLDRFWSLLNPDGGTLYLRFDITKNPSEGSIWQRFFESRGIAARGYNSALRLTRRLKDPEKLPRPKRADLVM